MYKSENQYNTINKTAGSSGVEHLSIQLFCLWVRNHTQDNKAFLESPNVTHRRSEVANTFPADRF